MGKITGFIEFEREKQPYRPIEERVQDWHQVMQAWPVEPLKVQAARCMDCGIPFCHEGCPLGNLIHKPLPCRRSPPHRTRSTRVCSSFSSGIGSSTARRPWSSTWIAVPSAMIVCVLARQLTTITRASFATATRSVTQWWPMPACTVLIRCA